MTEDEEYQEFLRKRKAYFRAWERFEPSTDMPRYVKGFKPILRPGVELFTIKKLEQAGISLEGAYNPCVKEFDGYLANPTIEHKAVELRQELQKLVILESIPDDLRQELIDKVAQKGKISDEWLAKISQHVNIPRNFMNSKPQE